MHATYLVSGMQIAGSAGIRLHEGPEDVPVPSSPFMSSSMPNQDVEEQATLRRVITLAREEHLDGIVAKELYSFSSLGNYYCLRFFCQR